jgi:hypothetical protein
VTPAGASASAASTSSSASSPSSPAGRRGARLNTSAAARWKPSGSPASAWAAAISSISPTQRQPFAVADRAARTLASWSSGSERLHSCTSSASTPSQRASARAASRSAALPFVHAAYAIFSAEASPGCADTAAAESAVPANAPATASASAPDRYSRVVPCSYGGGPMMPPSTKVAPPPVTSSPIARALAGATALAST